MAKKSVIIYPTTKKNLETMGAQIKTARLRRELPMDLVCERSGITRATLWKIEKGDPSVSLGAYVATLQALGGMDEDILLIAKDDATGRFYQDLNLKTKRRVKK